MRAQLMIGALLTTVFFSLSAIFAKRSSRIFGPLRANLGRLLCALIVMGLWAHLFRGGLGGAGRDWFLFSGMVGIGMGDLASFAAILRLGSRPTVLITQCVAAPIAAVVEWWWLGSTLTAGQMVAGAVILAGVAVALVPDRAAQEEKPITRAGVALGILAALGQGIGAVISRKALAVAAVAGETPDSLTTAYQRIIGGFVVVALWFAVTSFLQRKTPTPRLNATPRDYSYIPLNALCGAVIGITCYQWALATTPSGIVLPIVACTPLVIIPFSKWLENEEPKLRSIVGGVIAVLGVVALGLLR
jgi:drug/metabolite transporter (DMT)-like permease